MEILEKLEKLLTKLAELKMDLYASMSTFFIPLPPAEIEYCAPIEANILIPSELDINKGLEPTFEKIHIKSLCVVACETILQFYYKNDSNKKEYICGLSEYDNLNNIVRFLLFIDRNKEVLEEFLNHLEKQVKKYEKQIEELTDLARTFAKMLEMALQGRKHG